MTAAPDGPNTARRTAACPQRAVRMAGKLGMLAPRSGKKRSAVSRLGELSLLPAIVCTIGGALLYKKLCVPVPLEEAVHVVKDAVESASDVVETVIETSVS